MIGVATRSETDLVEKTEVLRASADELALQVDKQCRDIAVMRTAVEQIRADHNSHITDTIARMVEIDNELASIGERKHQMEKDTTAALRGIELIRRDLVLLGAKLAKEFITLPPAVSRYPRLDKASRSGGGVDGAGVGARAAHWYTDDQPAANLQYIDICVASAVAALDGRIGDAEFRDELEAARRNPESIFSKSSLIRSVAASSPARRRRGSLLMLSQASKELAKQSAMFDSLTRGPNGWTEAERQLALRAAETHDLMIREAVKELCKGAPVPRQAERQLLTSLNMHAMAAGRSVVVVDAAPRNAAGSPDRGNTTEVAAQASPTTASPSNPLAASGAGGRINIGVDVLVDAAVARANTTDGGRGRDPVLRRLQAELQDEQRAMAQRSHAARVRAWRELDLKRAGRDRLERNDTETAALLAAVASPPPAHRPVTPATPASVFALIRGAATVLSPAHPRGPGDGSGGGGAVAAARAGGRTPTPPHGFSAAPHGLPCPSMSAPASPASARRLGGADADVPAELADVRDIVRVGAGWSAATASVHRSTGVLLRERHGVVPVAVSSPVAFCSADEADVTTAPSPQSASRVVASAGADYVRAPVTRQQPPRQVDTNPTVAASALPLRAALGPRPVSAGVADPETATAAITMRRTGAIDGTLSFHSARLDSAAARAGVVRPPSASRFHWKLRPAAATITCDSGGVD